MTASFGICKARRIGFVSLFALCPQAHVTFLVQDFLWWTLAKLEPWIQTTRLRSNALAEVMRHIHFEVGIRICDVCIHLDDTDVTGKNPTTQLLS